MNGARSIFMRKGYWLTALAAIVLLAASPGTALAQTDVGIKSVKIGAADSKGVVAEGVSTVVTVTLTQKLPDTASATVTLAVALPAGGQASAGGFAELEDNPDLVLARTSVTILGGTDSTSVPLLTVNDLDAVDEKFVINASALTIDDAADPDTVTADATADTGNTPATGYVDDDEVQTYVFKAVAAAKDIKEGSVFEVSLAADPARTENDDVDVFVRAEDDDYDLFTTAAADTALTAALPFNEATNNQIHSIFVKAPANDGNRDDDVLTLTGLTGNVTSNKVVGTSPAITVIDVHQLPTAISGEAKGADEDGKEVDAVVTMVAEGGKAFLYVTVVNKEDDLISNDEEFTVTPTLTGTQLLDARFTPTSMNFDGAGEGSAGEVVVGSFMLEALNDEDIGMESLMVSLNVTGDSKTGSGTTSGTFSINIEDATAPLVSVKDGAYEAIMMAIGDAVTQGSVVTIMTDDMFDKAEGYTASFGASVEGDSISASASGDRITLTASSDMTGESKVTVTATARMASSSFIPSQTVSNVAEITFPVMVVEETMPEPVPALPLIAQWLLGLGLMGGGARQLFRRRRQGS